ncbi:hypothetical protein E2C01_046561 [Portunus trituberculatus]|uniref:Uncharacterized protein n=1 Tax=Portunus trituberculatus TaxID=210409 RepID=A0A5B7G5F2_PORTR|nr:hypothetical protein [Portunus trituberculatus]
MNRNCSHQQREVNTLSTPPPAPSAISIIGTSTHTCHSHIPVFIYWGFFRLQGCRGRSHGTWSASQGQQGRQESRGVAHSSVKQHSP